MNAPNIRPIVGLGQSVLSALNTDSDPMADVENHPFT